MKTRWMNRVVAGVLTLALAVSMTACGKKRSLRLAVHRKRKRLPSREIPLLRKRNIL
ncbi:hypothetical protein [Paenibacillus larvae]|uniref:hypothetical protein n=1 Tax=Paenibacillus larvae TaxID=1464 RepID=UPI00289342DF|nr:hypothetical protein [Paenibacillus larvae]